MSTDKEIQEILSRYAAAGDKNAKISALLKALVNVVEDKPEPAAFSKKVNREKKEKSTNRFANAFAKNRIQLGEQAITLAFGKTDYSGKVLDSGFSLTKDTETEKRYAIKTKPGYIISLTGNSFSVIKNGNVEIDNLDISCIPDALEKIKKEN